MARASHVFIADKLSEKFKNEFNRLKIYWVELNSEKRFTQFESILKKLKIPYKKPSSVRAVDLKEIINKLDF